MPTFPNSIHPTARDLQVLYLIYFLNACSIDHVAKRFFHGGLNTCYSRVSELRSAGLISWNRLGSTTGVGSGKALLSLTPQGRALLALEYLQVPPSAVRPLKQTSTAYGRDH